MTRPLLRRVGLRAASFKGRQALLKVADLDCPKANCREVANRRGNLRVKLASSQVVDRFADKLGGVVGIAKRQLGSVVGQNRYAIVFAPTPTSCSSLLSQRWVVKKTSSFAANRSGIAPPTICSMTLTLAIDRILHIRVPHASAAWNRQRARNEMGFRFERVDRTIPISRLLVL